jgi:hypothetical protein
MKSNELKKIVTYKISINDSLKDTISVIDDELLYDKNSNTFIKIIYAQGLKWTEGFYEYNHKDKMVFSTFKLLNDDGTTHYARVTFYDSKGRELETLYYGEEGLNKDRTLYNYEDSMSLATEKYIFHGDTNLTIWHYDYNQNGDWVKRIRMRGIGDTSGITIRKYDNNITEETEYWNNMVNYNYKIIYKYNEAGQIYELEKIYLTYKYNESGKIPSPERREYITHYNYDENYRISSQTYENGKLIESLIYKYVQ